MLLVDAPTRNRRNLYFWCIEQTWKKKDFSKVPVDLMSIRERKVAKSDSQFSGRLIGTSLMRITLILNDGLLPTNPMLIKQKRKKCPSGFPFIYFWCNLQFKDEEKCTFLIIISFINTECMLRRLRIFRKFMLLKNSLSCFILSYIYRHIKLKSSIMPDK